MSGTDAEAGLFSVHSKWFSLAFYAGIMAWVLLLLYWSRSWQWTNKLFPLMVGVPVILFTLLQTVDVWYPDAFDRLHPNRVVGGGSDGLSEDLEETAEDDMSTRSKAEQQRWELYMLAWVTALPMLMYFVGFAISIPIYTFALGWFFLRDVRAASGLTVGVSLFIYVLFVLLLGVPLWEGVLGLPNPLDYVPTPSLPI